MSLVAEDGTGLASAESYVSVADCAAYAVAHGLTFPASPADVAEAALRRATAYIDTYRSRFPGYRTKRRAQGLEWPRTGAYADLPQDADDHSPYRGAIYNPGYDYIPSDQVPVEIIRATCEAAARELASPGAMQPDLERGGAIQELQAGSVRVVYAANAINGTTMQVIDGLLAPLLKAGGGGIAFGQASRI